MGKLFVAKNKVRMHDTDMAGILYFPRQYRFAHDALEDFMESEGISFEKIFKHQPFVFVIVHAESDYYKPLHVGDLLAVHVSVEKVGTASFTMNYQIFREPEMELVGQVKTVHVSLENATRTKVPIPDGLRHSLNKYLPETPTL